MDTLIKNSPIATADEYDALYREGKEIEAKEEGRTPTDFFALLIKAVEEARTERGKVEVQFDHPTHVFIRSYRNAHSCGLGGYGVNDFQILHEYTHYL